MVLDRPAELSVPAIERADRRRWRTVYLATIMVAAGAAVFDVITPNRSYLATIVLVAALLAIAARPLVGVHVLVVGALLSDIRVAPWYPFVKNFSSEESLLYLSGSLVVNPLEIVLVATICSWLARRLVDVPRPFVRGRLLAPLAVFTLFVVLGLLNGLGRGGDVRIGLWEVRPLVYLPVVYVLVTNLVVSRRQYRALMWSAVAAVTVHAVHAIAWHATLGEPTRASMRGLTEHGASVHMNVVLVMALAALLFPWSTPTMRSLLALASVPVVWAYVLAERRSAFVGLALAIVLMLVVLYRTNRGAFWWFTPLASVAALVYFALFWNTSGGVGFAAQAIKSAVAPDQLQGADLTSNLYRELEAINVWFTIRVGPLRGIGFGQPFYRLYAMPDISSFTFWEYMPHHSFLWIWLKTGFAGFAAMVFVVLRTIQHGTRSMLRVPVEDRLVVMGAVLYVVMYLVFSYVDIAWDVRSMVFMAIVMAICADLDRLPGATPTDRVPRQALA